MLLGPFDRRKRRHRCVACTRSHLKCSGDSPCAACVKRNQSCHYSVVSQKRPTILVDRGTHETINTYRVVDTRLIKPLSADPVLFYFFYYEIFLEKNKFTGLATPREDVKELMKEGNPETSSYLLDAMLSLGAMQALKLCEAAMSKKIHQFALESYTRAIAGLRQALALFNCSGDVESRVSILWTTLLLGLFELMHDATGNGWLQHLVHGTAQALVAGGPSTCLSGSCGRFFTESKVFEVCRAIVFNQPSFLADEKWMALSASLRESSTNMTQKALDALLDIIIMCSSLRVQAASLIEALQHLAPYPDDTPQQAHVISLQGFQLRAQLNIWASTHHTSSIFRDPAIIPQDPSDPDLQLLAETFFSATSIYLSGVFDYEITYWQTLNLPAPTLTENEIQQHVAFILALSQRLVKTSISPLLLLFPLRVASARAQKTCQKQQIMKLLGVVRSSFAVAGAFMADIEDLWRYRGSVTTHGGLTGNIE